MILRDRGFRHTLIIIFTTYMILSYLYLYVPALIAIEAIIILP